MGNETSERKLDHIEVCLEEDVEAKFKTTGFEDIDLIPKTSPELDLDDVDISADLFGKSLDAPVLICPMTGGHERGKEINLTLAEAAQKMSIGLGVGSQRAAVEDPGLEDTYRVREVAPDVLLLGNLGAVQFNRGYGIEEAERAIEMIDADALGIHFNALQESIQPGGDTDFEDTLNSIDNVVSNLDTYVYVKETGAGINGSMAKLFAESGFDAVDVSGAGGTSWAGVEAFRESSNSRVGGVFWDWGIPTAVCTAEVSASVDVPVISSGGVRTGLDAAKALALGADFVSVGLPLFRASVRGVDRVVEWLRDFIHELKIAMFLTGSEEVESIQGVPIKISGETREWFVSRGLDLEEYSM